MSFVTILLALIAVGILYLVASGGELENRITGVKRLLFGIPFLAFMFFAGFIFGAYVVAIWILDSLYQILTGNPTFNTQRNVARLHAWRDHNTRFLLGQKDRPRWVP
jgi:hypothetical protein